MSVQLEFRDAVEEITQACFAYFSDRLLAIYITGSITTNEAIINESDLDYFGVISTDLSEEDKEWLLENEKLFDKKFNIFNGVHLNIKSADFFKRDKFSRFILRYNSLLYRGSDIIAEIDDSCNDSYSTDKYTAKIRLAFARRCFGDALKNTCPDCLDKIPKDTYLAARKFARYFVLVEGVYYLMSRGLFKSFKRDEVMKLLKDNITGYDEVLNLSHEIMIDPHKVRMDHKTYIHKVRTLVEWMFNEIERA